MAAATSIEELRSIAIDGRIGNESPRILGVALIGVGILVSTIGEPGRLTDPFAHPPLLLRLVGRERRRSVNGVTGRRSRTAVRTSIAPSGQDVCGRAEELSAFAGLLSI